MLAAINSRYIPKNDDSHDSTLSESYVPGSALDGSYRLIRVLGKGGTASVWRAYSESLRTEVAVKLLPRGTQSPESAARLISEAQLVKKLNHPSIVHVFDFGRTAVGDHFLAMELVEGQPLTDVIKRNGRLPEETAVRMLLPIASALAFAHSRGIIHRDVKPDNIMLAPTGAIGVYLPKLIDFGLARCAEPSRMHPLEEGRLTVEGSVLGSPGYMAPEQLVGERDVGTAADVWAFAVVLYELITGKLPFDGATVGAWIAAIALESPRPLTEDGGDEALWAILQRGLEKDPEKRWPSMALLHTALVEWARGRGLHVDISGAPILKLAQTSDEDDECPTVMAKSPISTLRSIPAATKWEGAALPLVPHRLFFEEPSPPSERESSEIQRETFTRMTPPPCSGTFARRSTLAEIGLDEGPKARAHETKGKKQEFSRRVSLFALLGLILLVGVGLLLLYGARSLHLGGVTAASAAESDVTGPLDDHVTVA